jgi:predicted RNA-binding Zn-ribbon protein involved in translation (DUF1610 family)
VFKTARFKVHNPSRHKNTLLWYAMTGYHNELKRTLEETIRHPEFPACVCAPDAKGRPRPNSGAVSKLVKQFAPYGWELAPLRDYLIGDATAMLLSHLNKEYKGKHESNPPTMPSLAAITGEEYQAACEDFLQTHEFPVKPQHQEKIDTELAAGHTQVAKRLSKIYRNYASGKAAGAVLQSLDPRRPHPIEFTRTKDGRGFYLARKANRFYFVCKLFAENHHYLKNPLGNTFSIGFVDCLTGVELAGKKYGQGTFLPLEFAREFHDVEYLQQGRPQSAKLVVTVADDGTREFYVHIAFEFTPQSVAVTSVLGMDRGAAKLGVATLVDFDGNVLKRGIELEGSAFSAEMARYRKQIADLQRKGKQKHRKFKVRGARADILVGEYANTLVRLAVENKAQIALEKIDKVTMSKFLTQSQFGKLQQMVNYKSARAGLPEPLEVPAAYTSQTCARCGHKDKESRKSQDIFLCTSCGHQDNADYNASEIIALRAVHQLQCGKKFQKFPVFQAWLQEHLKDKLAGKPELSNQSGG